MRKEGNNTIKSTFIYFYEIGLKLMTTEHLNNYKEHREYNYIGYRYKKEGSSKGHNT